MIAHLIVDRSRNAAAKAVTTILNVDIQLTKKQKELDDVLDAMDGDDMEPLESLMARAEELRGDIRRLKKNAEKLESTLGTADRVELVRLKSSDYLRMVVNARSLKVRIRTKLIERKFELSRMERACITSKPGKFSFFMLNADAQDPCCQSIIWRNTYPRQHRGRILALRRISLRITSAAKISRILYVGRHH